MQGDRNENRSGIGIRRGEGARSRVHVSGAQVVEVGASIVLLAGVEKIVFGGAGFREEVSESVVEVGVGHLPIGVREGADGAVPVVEVVVFFARAREADDLLPSGVAGDECAGMVELSQDLREDAGGVNQIVCEDAVGDFHGAGYQFS